MDVILLGTGSPIPDPRRSGPATFVRAGDATILIDCGRGTVMHLAGAGVLPQTLNAAVIAHMRSDHICDPNDVITSHWVMSPIP